MSSRLSKQFSSNKGKQALADAEQSRSSGSSTHDPPPRYEQEGPEDDRDHTLTPPDITSGFSNLKIWNASDGVPIQDECIAHLKVLEAFYRLKQSISTHDGLFGINDAVVTSHPAARDEEKVQQVLAKLAEKRWAIYVTGAVRRFEAWWDAMCKDANMLDRTRLERDGRKGLLVEEAFIDGKPIELDAATLPPIDVLMVWHAFMLNPRYYLEDCLRNGKMALWHCPIPWQAVAHSINAETFAYEASTDAETHFQRLTGRSWNNLDEEVKDVHLSCVACGADNKVRWTESPSYALRGKHKYVETLAQEIDEMLSSGTGFCDRMFETWCIQCSHNITHESLEANKLVNHVAQLRDKDVPMSGTILGTQGVPSLAHGLRDKTTDTFNRFPNLLLKRGLGADIIEEYRKISGIVAILGLEGVRHKIEDATRDKSYMRKVRDSRSSNMTKNERISIRKMMSCYWNNSSPFALNLVGAVIRQGSFIERMHNIDWLHSPALPSTMQRLVDKYAVFLDIMARHPNKMAVPTLDVDLAWHTHQLSPAKYFQYTVKTCRQFIDHDDKVAEVQLNDAFAWTSKTYQKMTGQPYSECTCWYCEAIRESHTSTASRIFHTRSAQATDLLHASSTDPVKSVHISAHNAVRPTDESYKKTYEKSAERHANELEEAWLRACVRAKEKGRPVPDRNDYYYSTAWGYPVYIPAYSPYTGFIPYAPMYYSTNPGCMAVGAGAAGSCCQGTCGAGVAAGGCSGASSGGCSGGALGGCGGGGGACGGGGGGGSGC